jgi:hypothetical protein
MAPAAATKGQPMPRALPLSERRDVYAPAIVIFAAALVIFLVCALVALRFIFGSLPHSVPFGFDTGLEDSGAPVLQIDEAADRAAYESEKRAALHGFGWADKAAGIARIPIEDAMRIIAERGLPARSDQTASGECGLLADNVPRAPQSANCAGGGAPR